MSRSPHERAWPSFPPLPLLFHPAEVGMGKTEVGSQRSEACPHPSRENYTWGIVLMSATFFWRLLPIPAYPLICRRGFLAVTERNKVMNGDNVGLKEMTSAPFSGSWKGREGGRDLQVLFSKAGQCGAGKGGSFQGITTRMAGTGVLSCSLFVLTSVLIQGFLCMQCPEQR